MDLQWRWVFVPFCSPHLSELSNKPVLVTRHSFPHITSCLGRCSLFANVDQSQRAFLIKHITIYRAEVSQMLLLLQLTFKLLFKTYGAVSSSTFLSNKPRNRTNFSYWYTAGVSGTSASSPTFAAVIALLNDARFAVGKPPLGFVNLWLYQVFVTNVYDLVSVDSINGPSVQLKLIGRDVVQGNNRNWYCPSGFPATTGWVCVRQITNWHNITSLAFSSIL